MLPLNSSPSLRSAVLLGVLLTPAAAASQEAQPTQPTGEEVFVDTVDVDVVNVDVVVTDAAGEPVRGLTRDDFVVREDGDPVELTNFYAAEGPLPVAAGDGAGSTDTTGAIEVAPAPSDQRLNLVVLIDNVHISPGARSRIVGEIEERLDEILQPGDLVLVAAIDPDIRVLRTFTLERAAIRAAFDRLELTTSRGNVLESDRRLVRREIDEAAGAISVQRSMGGGGRGFATLSCGPTPTDCARLTLDMIRSWSAESHTLNQRLLETLERFVRALAGLPGRRAILHVSEGFSVRPGEGLMEEWFQVFAPWAREVGVHSPESEAGRWDSTSDLFALAEAAAGSQVVFYSLEAGSGFHESLNPETRHVSAPSSASEVSQRQPLTDLAWRTGGLALLDGAGAGLLLERMATDFRNYYSLGYASPRSSDGAHHRIEVDVPGRRVRIRHTLGYRAATREQQTAESTLATLIFDVGSNPLGVRVEAGREQPEGGDRFVVPLLVRVPIASLALVPGETMHRGKVSIVVAVQDVEGRLSDPRHLDLPVEIPTEKLRDALDLQVAKGINLLVREGKSRLAVGVRDELAGISSTLNVDLVVGENE